MIKKIAMGLAVAVTAVSLTACIESPDYCAGLTASEQDKQAAASGYEVEKTDSNGYECELSQDGTTWNLDD